MAARPVASLSGWAADNKPGGGLGLGLPAWVARAEPVVVDT
jgi:hypothetical protein